MGEIEHPPSGWWWNPDVDAATLGGMLEDNKGRLISMAPFMRNSALRLRAVWVENAGENAASWWWNPDVTAATLGGMLDDNEGRLVCLEPYVTGLIGLQKVHFAAAWIENKGVHGKAWWWNPDVDPSTLGGMLTKNKGRLTSLRTYVLNGRRRYAAVWVANTGADNRAWWWNPDVDAETLGGMLDDNKGRLVSLDTFTVGSDRRFAGAWVENTGSDLVNWAWDIGPTAKNLGETLDRFCSYPIELRGMGTTSEPLVAVRYAYPAVPDPNAKDLLSISASAKVSSVVRNSDGAVTNEVDVDVTVEALGSDNVKVTRLDVTPCRSGGFLDDWTVLGTSDLIGASTTLTPGTPSTTSHTVETQMDTTHLLVVAAATAGTFRHHSHKVIAVKSTAGTAPPKASMPAPVFLGVWNNPVEVTPILHDGSTDPWLTVGGQLVNTSGEKLRIVGFWATVVIDGRTVMDKGLDLVFYSVDSSGFHVGASGKEEVTRSGQLNYFVHGFPLDVDFPFKKGSLQLVAHYQVDGQCGSAVLETPLEATTPLELKPPVRGTWNWGNGPDYTGVSGHSWPLSRFAYDLTVLTDGKTWAGTTCNDTPSGEKEGDCTVNDNFYAFGEPVYAMAGGTVLDEREDVLEHFGFNMNPASSGINRLVVHNTADDYLHVYYHLRRNKNEVGVGDHVSAGDQIARVGHNGGSSEPHLHVGCVRSDGTGRGRLVPMKFKGLETSAGASVNVVPGAGEYNS